jgi:hypothetical protein
MLYSRVLQGSIVSAVKNLAYLFRAASKPRPVLLLGAGASFRSGVPLADEAVRRIAKKAFARWRFGLDSKDTPVMPSDWFPYLQNQPWFLPEPASLAENFPLAVENLLIPREFRRDFFEEMIHAPGGPSDGYKSLARMMVKRLAGTILTTNFDCLIADALRGYIPKPPRILEIRTPDDLVTFGLHNDFQIVYLHGSVEHYQDKNLNDETKRLDEKLVSKIRPLLNESALIVVGYRGAEPSVMQHLLVEGIEDSGSFRNGLFWCIRQGERPHANVESLRQKLKSNFQLLEISGFDELLMDLDKELDSESWYSGSVGLSKTIVPIPTPVTQFDLEPLDDKCVDDLDHDLILSTLAEYCKRLKWPEINQSNYVVFLERQGFLQRRNGRLVPSKGCFLLFGNDVQKKFPYARVSFIQAEKSRTVIDGNLITQFRRVLDLLSVDAVNPRVRLKAERVAEEQTAYPPRALTELTVNLLVHRDYETQDYARINFARGRSLTFENPGGLLPEVRKTIQPDSHGRFEPVRGLTEMRNPLVADIFYGIGSMDKAGSGLADVQVWAVENGGKLECSIIDENRAVHVSLYQPIQEVPETSRVARPISKTELFVTNLLPFKVLPESVYFLPLRGKFVNAPIFDGDDNPKEVPIVIAHGGFLISFSDLREFPEFAGRKGFLNRLAVKSRQSIVGDRDNRNLFVWLLNKHWEFFLRRWPLVVEPRRKRAFFKLAGRESTNISYLSKTGRKASRDVVKKRGEEPNVSYENEAIHFAIAEFFGQWALQVRPTYVFTKRDGLTPLSPIAQTRRATRRFKFDRNPSVDNDLVFWSRYLSQGGPTLSIGNIGATEIVLDSEYCSAEVPRNAGEDADRETAN